MLRDFKELRLLVRGLGNNYINDDRLEKYHNTWYLPCISAFEHEAVPLR